MTFWILCLFVINNIVGITPFEDEWHRVVRRSIQKTATVGASEILECDINYPGGLWLDHIITWKKQDIEVPVFIQFHGYPPHLDTDYKNRIRLVSQASIELSDIRLSDEGWYECSIVFMTNDDEANSNGTWIHLAVNSPPVLGNASPSYLIQKEGATVDLFCDATATPEPTLTWYKDGRELQPSEKVTLQGNGVQVSDLMREDGGVYTCTFKNTVGQTSHIIKLVIEGNAYIMAPPKNTTISDGSKAKLQCQAEGYPNNITYRWYKGTVDVSTVPGLMDRAGIYADGSFVITNVEKEDTGWYICRPTNGLGPPPEAKAYLNVTYLPFVLSMPIKIYLPKGMLGKIECPTEANPPVTMVLWKKDTRQIDFAQTTRITTTKQGTLVIKEVTKEDQGYYVCTPFSPLGAGRPSGPVQVLIRDPPHFVVRPDHTYQRVPGDRVTMHCMADGDPKPTMTWRKADSSFPPTTKTLQDGGNLTIVNLSKEDHGTYECVATNVVTTIVTTALLLIEISPLHAPYNLTVDTAQLSATVKWLPAYDGSGPYHYVVWYKKKNSQENWQTLQVVPDGATSMTIHRLLPDTIYQFIVLSRNSEGEAKFSNIHSAKTKGYRSTYSSGISTPSTTPYSGPFPDPPYNLTVRQNVLEQLNISWNAPRNSPIPVLYYIVQFRTVGQWVNLTNEIVNTWFLWMTVSRKATYYFRVYSYSEVGRSTLPSETVTYETKDPMDEGVRISPTVIASFIGGLVSLFFLCILFALGSRYMKRRKKRAKHMRYGNGKFGNVKYFGPKTVEASNKQHDISEFDIDEERGEPAGGSPQSARDSVSMDNIEYNRSSVRCTNKGMRPNTDSIENSNSSLNKGQDYGIGTRPNTDNIGYSNSSVISIKKGHNYGDYSRPNTDNMSDSTYSVVTYDAEDKDSIISANNVGSDIPSAKKLDALEEPRKTGADDTDLSLKADMLEEPDSESYSGDDEISSKDQGDMEYPTLPCRSLRSESSKECGNEEPELVEYPANKKDSEELVEYPANKEGEDEELIENLANKPDSEELVEYPANKEDSEELGEYPANKEDSESEAETQANFTAILVPPHAYSEDLTEIETTSNE